MLAPLNYIFYDTAIKFQPFPRLHTYRSDEFPESIPLSDKFVM